MFLLIYTFIKVFNFKVIKVYLWIVEMTILWSTVMRFLENEVLNLGTLLVFLFVQGMLIYFIKIDYRKDVCRKDIYLKYYKVILFH